MMPLIVIIVKEINILNRLRLMRGVSSKGLGGKGQSQTMYMTLKSITELVHKYASKGGASPYRDPCAIKLKHITYPHKLYMRE